MNCKNCNESLENDALFCNNCGAKVVTNRITFRFLLLELFAMLGFDSLYFRTLKKLLITPHIVLRDYLNGVRKKYVNPFAYLAVGAAVSIVIFNLFTNNFIDLQKSFNTEQLEQLKELAEKDLSTVKDLSEKELFTLKQKQQNAKMQLKFQDLWVSSFLKYFNIMTFLLLPIYAAVSKWTFRKPNNYGEHIVMNAYLQGTTMYFSSIMFLLSVLIHPKIYIYSTFIYILYYLYVFGKLYNLNFKQIVLKSIRFIIVLIIISIILLVFFMILGIVVTIVIKTFNPESLNQWLL